MWAVFPIQDILGMSDSLKRKGDPKEEQINNPANPKNYWKYRLHINIEELIEAEEFNEKLLRIVKESGR
jgi:4-alpha-glucanotransferase